MAVQSKLEVPMNTIIRLEAQPIIEAGKKVGAELFAVTPYGRQTHAIATAFDGPDGGSTAVYCIGLLADISQGKATFKDFTVADFRNQRWTRQDVAYALRGLFDEHYW
jgi:hypothetical protein